MGVYSYGEKAFFIPSLGKAVLAIHIDQMNDRKGMMQLFEKVTAAKSQGTLPKGCDFDVVISEQGKEYVMFWKDMGEARYLGASVKEIAASKTEITKAFDAFARTISPSLAEKNQPITMNDFLNSLYADLSTVEGTSHTAQVSAALRNHLAQQQTDLPPH